ncbi:MAG: 50S ribosomal protein L7/L12 [Mariprofundaceae bacterium]|nr:50S ribosomal protein L7/L12 [Mariprofundaceae bacterium]
MAKALAKEDMIAAIESMTVLEMSELVTALEDKFGVSAAAPVAVVAAPAADGDAEAAEEKSAFDVVLTAAGDKKIQVIKAVREITGLGLKDAKGLVDDAPKPIKEGAAREEAEEIKAKLEAAGATVELK